MSQYCRIKRDLSNLKDKEVIIFGVHFGGTELQLNLKKRGIEIKYFCDNNPKLWNTEVNGVKVLPLQEFMMYCISNPQTVIQIGSQYEEILKEQLIDMELENTIYLFTETLFILNLSLCDNLDNLGNGFLDKCMEIQYKYLGALREKIFMDSLINQKLYDDEIIMNYSCPKVGNITIDDTLKHYNKNVYTIWHTFKHIDDDVKQIIKEESKKVVAGIREPIAHAVSKAFQRYSITTDGRLWRKEHFENDTSTEVITLLKNEHLKNWFKNEIQANFNIDVLNYDFDKEKGYSIIEDNDKKIFLYKLEKLNDLNKEFGEFINVDNLEFMHSNNSDDTWYRDFYNEFRKNLSFDNEFLNNVYDNEFVKHFYSEEEISAFKEKWSK